MELIDILKLAVILMRWGLVLYLLYKVHKLETIIVRSVGIFNEKENRNG